MAKEKYAKLRILTPKTNEIGGFISEDLKLAFPYWDRLKEKGVNKLILSANLVSEPDEKTGKFPLELFEFTEDHTYKTRINNPLINPSHNLEDYVVKGEGTENFFLKPERIFINLCANYVQPSDIGSFGAQVNVLRKALANGYVLEDYETFDSCQRSSINGGLKIFANIPKDNGYSTLLELNNKEGFIFPNEKIGWFTDEKLAEAIREKYGGRFE